MKLSTRRLFFIILFWGLLIMTIRPIADPDFWWHLRTGELIIQTRSIPHIDLFSYTKVGGVWITHEWLSEILIFGIFKLGGYGSLVIFFSIIITGAFLLSYFRSPVETRPYVAGFVTVVAAISSAPLWGVRPQMISLLLTSIFLLLLESYRRKGKILYLIPLPLITLLWVNMHGGYLLSITIIAIYIIGSVATLILSQFNKEKSSSEIKIAEPILYLSICLGVCFLATLVNPNGIKIIIYPFQTLVSPSMQQFIQEWSSPDFHQLIWQPFAWLILSLIVFGMISKKTISPTNILLVLFFGYAALQSMRNVPLFAIIVIPVLSEQIGSLITIPNDMPQPRWRIRSLELFLLLGFLALTSFRFFQVVRDQSRVEAEEFPKAAVDWLVKYRPQGNLFNSYDWGGYLIWRLYPEYRVFIDGRADVYGDKFIYDYLTVYRAAQGWENKLDSRSVNIILIESDAPLVNVLLQSPVWRIAYKDKMSNIFIRP